MTDLKKFFEDNRIDAYLLDKLTELGYDTVERLYAAMISNPLDFSAYLGAFGESYGDLLYLASLYVTPEFMRECNKTPKVYPSGLAQ